MVEWIYKLTDISSIKRISFRQDINGLRAIAVLAVVFYHAELELFKGGWLGVDIFFVISGYLISNIIISELNDGTFTFKNFYLRRVRRILPALFSTLLLTIPFAYFFLSPKALEEYIDSLIASVFFYANYHFMNLDFYVAESTQLMPLLHTWSLAIEEQYYLLFPLFAYIIYKYFKKYFTFFIGFLTIGSLYLNSLTQSTDKFYRLETRMWELLLGVLVMIISNNLKIKHLEKIGLPLMLIPIFYFGDDRITYIEPKLIAIIGISMIIFSNTDSSVLTKLLGIKVISIIGFSSYSMYLLHQPLFAFYKSYKLSIWENYINNSTEVTTIETAMLLLITLIGSVIFYNLIELKFLRNILPIKLLTIFVGIIFSFVLFINQNIESFYKNYIPQGITEYENKDIYNPLDGKGSCHSGWKDENPIRLTDPCVFNPSSQDKVFVIGDSHLKNVNTLVRNTKTYDYSLTQLTIGGCIFQFNLDLQPDRCGGNYRNIYSDKISNIKDSIIIYGGRFPIYLTGEPFFNGYVVEPVNSNRLNKFPFEEKAESIRYTINKFLENNNKVILIYPIPEQAWDPYKIYSLNAKSWSENLSYSYDTFKLRMQSTYDVLDSLNSDNIFRVYPEKIFCDTYIKNQCVAKFGNKLFYDDDDHLSPDGEILLSKEILKTLDIILSY